MRRRGFANRATRVVVVMVVVMAVLVLVGVDTLHDAALGRIDSPFPWARSPVDVDVDRRGVPWAGAIGTGFLDGTDSELDWTITSFEPRRPPSPAD